MRYISSSYPPQMQGVMWMRWFVHCLHMLPTLLFYILYNKEKWQWQIRTCKTHERTFLRRNFFPTEFCFHWALNVLDNQLRNVNVGQWLTMDIFIEFHLELISFHYTVDLLMLHFVSPQTDGWQGDLKLQVSFVVSLIMDYIILILHLLYSCVNEISAREA